MEAVLANSHYIWNGILQYLACVFIMSCSCVNILAAGGEVMKLGVFAPVNCTSMFPAALQKTLDLAASDLISYDHVNMSTFIFDSCDESNTLLNLVDVFSAKTYHVVIGPGQANLCEPTARLGQHWDAPVISWACSGEELARRKEFSTFSRTVPSDSATAVAVSSVLNLFRWKYSVIFASEILPWRDLCKNIFFTLNQNNLVVESYLEMEQNFTSSDALDAILQIQNKVKGIVICLPVEEQRVFFLAADRAKLTLGNVAFLVVDLLGTFDMTVLQHNVTDTTVSSDLLRAVEAVFLVSPVSSGVSAVNHTLHRREAHGSKRAVSQNHVLTSLYNAIQLAGYGAQAMYKSGQTDFNTKQFLKNVRNATVPGHFGSFHIDSSGEYVTDFQVMDYQPLSDAFLPVITVNTVSGSAVYTGIPIHWPNGVVLEADACAFGHSDCITGFSVVFIPAILVPALLLVALSIVIGFLIRRRIVKREMERGPNKILLTVDDLVFVNAKTNSKSSTRNLKSASLFDKPDLLKASEPSLSANSYNEYGDFTNTARYNGDLVFVKELHIKGFEMKNKVLRYLKQLRELRHENINPFMGCFTDPLRPAIVMEYCSRKSLEDVIHNEDIKLDWSFKLSLLTDLVRGIRYLHSTSLRQHGSLKSGNCVIDSRWVLKLTDYAVCGTYERYQTIRNYKARDLLWTAPEILRDDILLHRGSQKGDVYSFAIIMQELILRGHPYCMLDLDPEDIIRKVRKPPPLCRPSVSQGAAPPQYIQIMKRCWAEMPDMRPDFEQIYQDFKDMNKGKKMNIVDTMFKMLEKYSNDLEDIVRDRTELLEVEKKKTEQLLTRMLPASVAESLVSGKPVEAETFGEVTIYFSDIVGFTTISAMSTPMQVVDLLNDLYTMFDATIEAYDIYKVETIGDAYMTVSGLPVRNGNQHAGEVGTMALDLLSQCGTFTIRHMPEIPLRVRIGLHTGSCVAGVVGLTMPRYCLFGDTVNTASRMESSGQAFRIHISQDTKDVMDQLGGYHTVYRGEVELKGKGMHKTYWLVGKDNFKKPLPRPPSPCGEDNHGLGALGISMEKMESKDSEESPSDSSDENKTIKNDISDSTQEKNDTKTAQIVFDDPPQPEAVTDFEYNDPHVPMISNGSVKTGSTVVSVETHVLLEDIHRSESDLDAILAE